MVGSCNDIPSRMLYYKKTSILLSACTQPADIAFLIDSSGSVEKENYHYSINFIKDIVKQMNIGSNAIRVSVAVFNGHGIVELPLRRTTTMEDVFFTLDNLNSKYRGGKTNTANGLAIIRNEIFNSRGGDRPNVPNYVVVITDGIPNIDEKRTIQEAINNLIEGIHTILVLVGTGLTTGRNYLKLHAIASEPYSQNIFSVESYKSLLRAVPGITNALCDGKKLSLFNSLQKYNLTSRSLKHMECSKQNQFCILMPYPVSMNYYH